MRIVIKTDGGARGNPGPAALGVSITDDQDQVLFEQGVTIGIATNNEAEYQAFHAACVWLVSAVEDGKISAEQTELLFRLDSKLVVEQLLKHWKIKEPRMAAWAQKCWQLLNQLHIPYSIAHIPREQNRRADELVNQALDAA